MARFRSRVQVYESQIQSLFVPGVDNVNSEATKITEMVLVRAVREAPMRSGHLAASHRRSVVPSGRYGTRGFVENTARYAGWVHGGTEHLGFIYPKTARALKLRPGNGYPYSIVGPRGGVRTFGLYARRVRGQAPNDWLLRAANDVLWRYGVIVTEEHVDLA